ncbi:MAG: peptide/nickel transport system permease protein [Chloroflexota bacterium]|nr:peptide/nickel transport system permease protein [Chloroflexota bacterium]
MLKYIVRRLLGAIPVLFGLSVVLFAFVHLLPGDPCRTILGQHATVEACDRLRQNLGLDLPLWQQYVNYIGQLVRGDFGASIVNNKPVLTEFAVRFPATIELTVAALIFAVGVGIPLGRLAARHVQGWIDGGVTVISLFGISIPVFVLGLVLVYIFAVELKWLPTQGRIDARAGLELKTNFVLVDSLVQGRPDLFFDGLKHLILPAIALGSIPLAIIARITRAAVLDVANEDYVRTARAKGLSERRVDSRHIMRNAWLPVVTVIGLQVGGLLGGAVLTETVFSWNGVGRWVVDSIQGRDYFVIQSTILIFALIFLVVNLAVDVAYAFINPRIRYS